MATVLIVVDVAAAMAGKGPSALYMMDNRKLEGSTGEGTTELHTHCSIGDAIYWQAIPVNYENAADTVVITGIQTSSGKVFGFDGAPKPIGFGIWQGTAENAGNDTYQVRVLVNGTTTLNWDPFINVS